MNTVAIPKQYFEVTFEDNAVLADIKRAMKMIRGIASVRIATPANVEKLNATTIRAIEDVKAGKTHKASSVDDLLTQCLATVTCSRNSKRFYGNDFRRGITGTP